MHVFTELILTRPLPVSLVCLLFRPLVRMRLCRFLFYTLCTSQGGGRICSAPIVHRPVPGKTAPSSVCHWRVHCTSLRCHLFGFAFLALLDLNISALCLANIADLCPLCHLPVAVRLRPPVSRVKCSTQMSTLTARSALTLFRTSGRPSTPSTQFSHPSSHC
jgi:hypothetical protein